jgi:dTDP-4-dehydrorhamnose reductase
VKILLFGRNGQVGWELQRALAPLGELHALGSDAADFAEPESLAASVRALRPEVVVNAAAHTAVDRAEAEPERARRINAEAPAVLAREAAAAGAWLVHYSTDYVFDGSGDAPRGEDAPDRPAQRLRPNQARGRAGDPGERRAPPGCCAPAGSTAPAAATSRGPCFAWRRSAIAWR